MTSPYLDPEFGDVLATRTPMERAVGVTLENLEQFRAVMDAGRPDIDELVERHELEHRRYWVPSTGDVQIAVSTFARRDHARAGAAYVNIHGGGMIGGDHLSGIESMLRWVEDLDVVAATVGYRLAPEHPDPAPVEDCIAAWNWFVSEADELRFDPDRIVLFGGSAGAGLAAGTALAVRDRGGRAPSAVVLHSPMLDDRSTTRDTADFDGFGLWDARSNLTGWTALLGDRRGGDAVSIYSAPGRATDLAGLPPLYLDIGSADLFRDDCVDFASRVWRAGGAAELHVWPGAPHGFEGIARLSPTALASVATREAWIERALSG